MLSVDPSRDTFTRYFSSESPPLAATIVRTPVFYIGDSPDPWAATNNTAQTMNQVRGPGMAAFVQTTAVSAGAQLTLYGGTTNAFATTWAIWTVGMAAVAVWDWSTILAAVGAAPAAFSSPFRFWRMEFRNGAVDQAAGWVFSVRAGGFLGA